MGCSQSYQQEQERKKARKYFRTNFLLLCRKIEFHEIHIEHLEFVYEQKFLYYHKIEGFQHLVNNIYINIEKLIENLFPERKIKTRVIIKFIYFFYSNHKDLELFKKKFLFQYFEYNKYRLDKLKESIEILPKIIIFLLVQSLIAMFLPDKEKDLKYFLSGRTYDGLHGSQANQFVAKKFKELWPNASTSNLIKEMKDYIVYEDVIKCIYNWLTLDLENAIEHPEIFEEIPEKKEEEDKKEEDQKEEEKKEEEDDKEGEDKKEEEEDNKEGEDKNSDNNNRSQENNDEEKKDEKDKKEEVKDEVDEETEKRNEKLEENNKNFGNYNADENKQNIIEEEKNKEDEIEEADNRKIEDNVNLDELEDMIKDFDVNVLKKLEKEAERKALISTNYDENETGEYLVLRNKISEVIKRTLEYFNPDLLLEKLIKTDSNHHK